MNRLIKVVLCSLSTTVMAASVYAAPPPPNNSHGHTTGHPPEHHHDANHHDQYHPQPNNHHPEHNRPPERPYHSWKPGYSVPPQYRGRGYYVDYHSYNRLYRPGRNEQWIRVNGDYVLFNTVNHHVIRIIPRR